MNETRLKNAFAEVLGISVELINDELKYNSVKKWDSVGHMTLIASIEQEFDIMIDTDDVINMSSFAKAKEIISKYGVDINA